MKLSLLIVCIGFNFSLFQVSGQGCLPSQDFESAKMAQSIMKRNPVVYYKWDYVTGTVMRGFQELWDVTRDPVYFDYIKSTIDASVLENGSIPGYSVTEYNIDHVKTGSTLLFLYRETGLEKYKKAAELVRSQLNNHPRTSQGGFWHKNIYPHQMWLDGLYMSGPFYAEYSLMFDEPDGFDDVVNQLLLMEQVARDPSTGLLYHGWDESGTQSWADPVTKTSACFWGRAVGWYAMALIDVLDYLPAEHSGRSQVIAILQRLAHAIGEVQDEETGTWYQVLDQGDREDNWIESSVTSMFVYSLAKGVRKGYLDVSYLEIARKGWEGIVQEFVTTNPDGTINLIRNCAVAGLGFGRDGSYDYYVNQTTINQNDGKGLGAFMNASLEIEVLNKIIFPLGLMVVDVTKDYVSLSWNDRSDNETGFLIERCEGNGFVEAGTVAAGQTSFKDYEVLNNKLYTYRVRAFNDTYTSFSSNIITVNTLSEDGKPSRPVNPSPQNGALDVAIPVLLSWEQGFGAEGYKIYAGDSENLSFVDETNSKSFLLLDLDANTKYYWRVDAFNEFGTTMGDVWSFTTKPPKMMVGYWPLDEIDNSKTNDLSGFNNHGDVVNLDQSGIVDGLINNGMLFNGLNQYVQVPHNSIFDFDFGSFTMMFWMKQDMSKVDFDKEYRYVIKGSHIKNPSLGRSGNRYEVYYKPLNTQFRFAIDDDVVKSEIFASPQLFVTGDWVHVAAVRDAINGRLNLYANAQLVATGNDNTSNISQNEDLFFGFSTDFGSHFEGILDEVKLFNFALSDLEIDSVYHIRSQITSVDTERFKTGSQFLIFPNPSTDQLFFQVGLQNSSLVSIRIFDLSGVLISNPARGYFPSGMHIFPYPNSVGKSLTPGVYVCVFETETERFVEKLVIN